MTPRSPARLFWPLVGILVLADCSSKRAIEATIPAAGRSVPIVDGVLRFTLAYNRGAAFSANFGPYQRWLLVCLTLMTLVVMARSYRRITQTGRFGTVALALVVAGAIGNLMDRLMSSRGVVDFIDIGIHSKRFYIFNVADMCVSVGALALAYVLSRSDQLRRHRPVDAVTSGQ